jgi:hypothetical protein
MASPFEAPDRDTSSAVVHIVVNDAAILHEASGPLFKCPACFDTFKVSEAFEVGCGQAHRFCIDDIKRHVESRLRSNEIPTCPMCKFPIVHEF